jgi:uncharacterized membrane protein YbjE (DUF340 family)
MGRSQKKEQNGHFGALYVSVYGMIFGLEARVGFKCVNALTVVMLALLLYVLGITLRNLKNDSFC